MTCTCRFLWLVALCMVGHLARASDYVSVGDFVAKSKDKADHTEAIRAAFAHAAKTRREAVLFPPGAYTVSDTIDISGAVEIVGHGYPRIHQSDPSKDIFHTDRKWRITLKGLVRRQRGAP